ncbi:response regulator [Gemmata sp.]|uniref:response regulator n=1 Tax=Gemmata sp. TaxID=1914242 RepID=UPI003F7061EB
MPSIAQSLSSGQVTTLLREALTSARAGDTARSHKLFQQITSLDPGNEAAWLWYANTAADPAEAVRGVRAALGLNPQSAPALAALPVALFRAGVAAAKAKDRERAAQFLADATDADPSNEGAWLWRAGVCDDPALSLEYLERVLKINPTHAQAREGIARLRAQLAPAWCCPVCDHRPTSAPPDAETCPRCRAVVTLRRPEAFERPPAALDHAALKDGARRLKSAWAASGRAEAAFGLGLALLNLGFADEGVRALETAARAPDSNPEWREGVARLVAHRRAAKHRGAAPKVPPRIPVMVVDDSATVRTLVSSVLTGAGYHVVAADGAEEASRLISAGNLPRLFILDVNMPGVDGFGFCKVLRGNAETTEIPVVFLTGKTGLLNKLHGRWVGAAEYLTKPFENEKLLDTVARLTSASRA